MAGGKEKTPEEIAAEQLAERTTEALSHYLLLICGAVSVAVIVWKVIGISTRYARTLVCLNDPRQRYFTRESPNVSAVKRHVLYAPVLSKRHNREIQLSSAINVGTLPTRFQLLFLMAYFATNVAFCVVDIRFSDSLEDVASLVRSRTGVLATINMIPLFILVGRNNPLIPLLGISFDTYNLIHRWFGRIVALEALAHTLAHLAKSRFAAASLQRMVSPQAPFIFWGFMATVAFLGLCIQAWSPLRHSFYEVFKLIHIGLAALAIAGLWYHIKLGELAQMKYLYVVIGVWVADRTGRGLRLFYYNIGSSRTRTLVEALPGNACRVTMTLSRPWHYRPGQHAYLYLPGISFWQSHPFSVAWVDGTPDVNSDKLVSNVHDMASNQKTEVSFVIRARTGMTNTLLQKALAAPDGRLNTMGFVEGPYGVDHRLDSYGTVVLFAGGVGVTHQVPYVRDLVAGYNDSTVATRKILLVWTIQSPEHLEWIRPWMTEILAMERRREILRIMIFVSKPRSTKEIHSPSSTVQMFPGRPKVETLLAMEQEQQVGAMAVSVCGPGGLSDEVRLAVRQRQSRSNIDFIEEAFSCLPGAAFQPAACLPAMASRAIVPFLVAMMLLTGVCNTLLTKYQDNQCVRNCDNPDPRKHVRFEQPVLQSAQMFVGEMGCWLVVGAMALYRRLRFGSASSSPQNGGYEAVSTNENADALDDDADGSRKAKATSVLRGWRVTLLALPAICDICGTTLMNAGLLLVAASIYQMTRGALVLFVGLFSVIFLRRRLHLYQWLSLVGVVLGVAVVGLAGAIWPDKPVTSKLDVDGSESDGGMSSATMAIVGVLLIAGAQIFTATQFVLEEWILEHSPIAPINVVGWEGIFGFVVTVLAMIVLHFAIGQTDAGRYGIFDMKEGWRQISTNRELAVSSVLIMISIGGFNFFGLSVTRSVSATARSTIDTCRTLFIWIVSLGLGWERFKWLQVLGFAILVYATFVFNGIVQPPLKSLQVREDESETESLLPEEPIEHF
ncbi:hypothetical protein HJFPF1_03444 [Paramyrothecium foliicola]|nr:hypothetical protein HJFPF1_03444 [Paramyrothecium foliicola]